METGKAAGTSISDTGSLTVASDETLATLTVKATSTVDTTEYGTATVTASPSSAEPVVTSVTVSPPNPSVAKGGAQQFTATVNGKNNPPQTVAWSIVETGKAAGTSISDTGSLTVASDETLATLTVKATSTVDTAKYGTATVTARPISVKSAMLDRTNISQLSTDAGYISMGYDRDLDCIVLTYKVGVIANMFLQYLSVAVVARPGVKFTYAQKETISVTKQIENVSMTVANIGGTVYFAGAKASAYAGAMFLGFGGGAAGGIKASASAGAISFDLTSVTKNTYTETYTESLERYNSVEHDMSLYKQGKAYAVAAFADIGVYQVLKYNPEIRTATVIPGRSLYFNVESEPVWDMYEYSKNEEIDIPNKLTPFQQTKITVKEDDLFTDLKTSETFRRTNDLTDIGSSSRDEVFNPDLLATVLKCFGYNKVIIDVSFAYKAESVLGGGLRLQIANSNKSAELSRGEFRRGMSWGDGSYSTPEVNISSLNSPTCQFMLLWSKTGTCEYRVGARTISITAVK